jgi:ABC-type Fe3+ transport system substrate-binding protein
MNAKKFENYLTGPIWVVMGAFLLAIALTPRVSAAASLSELIAAAKKEGSLNATVISSMHGKTTAKIIPAFKKRFGLDIEVTLTGVRSTSHYGRAAAATRAGSPPTYDAIEGSELSNVQLIGVGGTQKIDGWESLLKEINPLVASGKVRPEQISAEPFTGHGFKYLSRVKGIIFNPKLISKGELPKTHADLSNPKYKDRWTQPPWTSHWEVGTVVIKDMEKEKWLQIVKKAGKNAAAVQSASKGVRRVLLGEYAFGLANTYEALRAKAKDAKAPIDVSYFKDYNQTNSALFVMWMGTPEAKAIWQPQLYATQFIWGESELDRKVRRLIKDSGANIFDYLQDKKSVDFLKWYGTKDGRAYSKALGRAIRGRSK